MGGEADDGGGVEGAGEVGGGGEGLVEGLGGLVVGDEDKGGGFLREELDEIREVKGAGGEGEAGDAAAALTGVKVTADSVEGFGCFEVGEEIADEGEDHAEASLSRV